MNKCVFVKGSQLIRWLHVDIKLRTCFLASVCVCIRVCMHVCVCVHDRQHVHLSVCDFLMTL